jgi:hypothetical protein
MLCYRQGHVYPLDVFKREASDIPEITGRGRSAINYDRPSRLHFIWFSFVLMNTDSVFHFIKILSSTSIMVTDPALDTVYTGRVISRLYNCE